MTPDTNTNNPPPVQPGQPPVAAQAANYCGDRGWFVRDREGRVAAALNASEGPQASAPAGGAGDVDMLEAAWGLIANAWGGDWHGDEVGTPCADQRTQWREAAERWRDKYHARIRHAAGADGWSETPPSEPGDYFVAYPDGRVEAALVFAARSKYAVSQAEREPRIKARSREGGPSSSAWTGARWCPAVPPQVPQPATKPEPVQAHCGHPPNSVDVAEALQGGTVHCTKCEREARDRSANVGESQRKFSELVQSCETDDEREAKKAGGA